MSNEQPHHDKWRDLLRPSYDYPEDLDDVTEGLKGRARRKARRGAKKQWREADRQARDEFIAARREEPVSQGARLGFAMFLALVVVVAGIVMAVRSGGEEEPAAAAPSTSAEPTAPTASAPTTTTEPTAEEEPADEPESAAGLDVEDVTTKWATAWFTYTPASGDDQSARLERAEPYMSDELATFLWGDDAVATAYEKEGTDVTATNVKVKKAPEDAAPVDTDVRATRLVDVESTYTAGPDEGETITGTYLVTLIRADADAPWQVADFTGQEH